MSKQEWSIQLSEAEIRAAYAQGEEAVVSLVTLLLGHGKDSVQKGPFGLKPIKCQALCCVASIELAGSFTSQVG